MSAETINSQNPAAGPKGFKYLIPVILSALVGIVLLVSGLQKVFEIDLFIRQIRDYEIITNPLLIILGAWGVVTFECCLGAALIFNYRPKIAVPLGLLIFLVFIGATGYAWKTGVTEDCGCFGSWIERTPGEAMVEDLFLFAALLAAWKWNRTFKRWPFFLKEILVGIALLAGFLIPVTMGPVIDRITSAVTEPAKEGLEPFILEGFTERDLSKGKHIIIVMETDCSHCRAEMEFLNAMALDKDLPEVIAVTMNDEQQREDFAFEYDSAFDLFKIPDNDFWRLLGDGEIPRTILINEGMVLKKWDFAAPGIDELKAALNPR